MANQIFYLMGYDDIEKSSYGEKIILLTTDSDKIRKAIEDSIENGSMEYDGETIDEMIDNFNHDWKRSTRDTINDKLMFGFYSYAYDGELW